MFATLFRMVWGEGEADGVSVGRRISVDELVFVARGISVEMSASAG